MEKPTGGKVQEKGGLFRNSVTTRSTLAAFRLPYGMELGVSLLATHAARDMVGSTSKLIQLVTALRSGGHGAVINEGLMKMFLQTSWRYGC